MFFIAFSFAITVFIFFIFYFIFLVFFFVLVFNQWFSWLELAFTFFYFLKKIILYVQSM